MQVVILCGGQGTRIRDMTDQPKALVRIGPYPIIYHIMLRYLYYFPDCEFILALGYKGEAIKEYFLHVLEYTNDFTAEYTLGNTQTKIIATRLAHTDAHKMQITFVDTGEQTETAGRLLLVQEYLHTDQPFMLTYADGLSDIDLSALHRSLSVSDNYVGIVTGYKPRMQFGLLRVNTIPNTTDVYQVQGFDEKPYIQQYINAGFMIFKPKIFDIMNAISSYGVTTLSLENQVLPVLAEQGLLGMYPHNGFWQQMDTYKDYQSLLNQWEFDERPWLPWLR